MTFFIEILNKISAILAIMNTQNTQNVYTKNANSLLEVEIYKTCSEHDISPPILECHGLKITTPYYTCLFDFPNEIKQRYIEQIATKLDQMHALGFLWLDGSEENVVVDEEKNIAYIIDFGLSRKIADLKFDTCDTLERAKLYEIEDVKFFTGCGPKQPEYDIEDGVFYIDE